jgi:hypothetical protein
MSDTATAVASESNTALARRTIGSGIQMGKRGPKIESLGQAFEVAKLMSQSSFAVPPHCRDQHGVCFGILIQALAWELEPYAVANKSYVTGEGDKAKLAYESQLIHAVIELRAPIKERLSFEIIGTGDDRQCRVWTTFKGESAPKSFTSEPLREFTKTVTKQGRNGPYQVGPKSPLWFTKPEVQLFYNASRDWARIYCPDVILGIYTPDELEEAAEAEASRQLEPPPATRPARPPRPDAMASLEAFGAPAREAAEPKPPVTIDHDEDGVVIDEVQGEPDDLQDEPLAAVIQRLMGFSANIKTPEDFGRLMGTITGAARPGDSEVLRKWWASEAVRKLRNRVGVEVSAVPAMTAEIDALAASLKAAP